MFVGKSFKGFTSNVLIQLSNIILKPLLKKKGFFISLQKYLSSMKIIITEKQLGNLRLRRNIDEELPKYITSAFKWLNPKAFGNFDEFLERVIFSASRDYTSAFMENIENTEDYYSLWESMKPFVRDIVMNQYFDEILHYYNSKF